MNPDATMNKFAFKYEGMTREECREELLKDLEKEGLLINTNDKTIIKTLKLEDVIINDPLNINSYNVKVGELEAVIYYEKVITEEELKLKEKQISDLQASIIRRKNLLANENYVNKAPANLVETEREKLLEEEKLLESLVN